jgi:ribonuclease HI
VLRYKSKKKELSGAELDTTNNRMEMMAALQALEALKRPCVVTLHTDSQYVQKGITSWINGWRKNGWVTKTKEPVKNADLWQRLDAECQRHNVTWKWVKGHAGIADNERCDHLAVKAMCDLTGRPMRQPGMRPPHRGARRQPPNK